MRIQLYRQRNKYSVTKGTQYIFGMVVCGCPCPAVPVRLVLSGWPRPCRPRLHRAVGYRTDPKAKALSVSTGPTASALSSRVHGSSCMHTHLSHVGLALILYELRGQDTVSRGRNPNEGQVIAMVAWLDRCNHVVPTNWLGSYTARDKG